MYLIGNAQQLASHSPMWDTIIKDLTEQDAIGTALQVACSLHGEVLSVDKPGVLSTFAPDGKVESSCTELTTGGCTRPCGELIPKCGHPCPKRVRVRHRLLLMLSVTPTIARTNTSSAKL